MVLIFKYYLLNIGKSHVLYPFYVLKGVLSEMLALPLIEKRQANRISLIQVIYKVTFTERGINLC